MDDYPWSTRWLHHLGSHHIWRGCIKDASWLRPKCFQPERRANQATTEHQTNRDDDMERSYLGENTASHQHSAVKLRWALSVLSSVTPWEPRVTFCSSFLVYSGCPLDQWWVSRRLWVVFEFCTLEYVGGGGRLGSGSYTGGWAGWLAGHGRPHCRP